MTGQRSAAQNSSVTSAYCPPPALVAADSAVMPDSFTAVDLGGEQAVASSRCPDRQIGTIDCGSGIGPSTSTFAPMPRSCCTRRGELSIHAGAYGVKPGMKPQPGPYTRHVLTTTSRGCSARNRAMI